MTIKEQLRAVAKEYARQFGKIIGIEPDYWTGGELSLGSCLFGDYFFVLNDLLENAIIDDDLFHFESQDHEKRKQNVRNEIEQLNRDEYQIDEFPEYINKIKLWI